jgi:hypothetical protein
MKRKTIYLFTFIISVFVFIYISRISEHKQVHQKCPNEYGIDTTGSTQYQEDFDLWTNNFYDTHPGATLGDWNKARYQFWVDNDCTEAIQRYYEAKSMNKTI